MAANPFANFVQDLLAAIPAPPPPPGAAWFRPNNPHHHHQANHKTKHVTKTHTRTLHRYRTALRTHTATRTTTKTAVHTAIVPRTRKVYKNVYETQVRNKTRWVTRHVTATKTLQARAVTDWVTARVTGTRTVEETVTATATRTVTEMATATVQGAAKPAAAAGALDVTAMGAWIGGLLLFLMLLGMWNTRGVDADRRVRRAARKVGGWAERAVEVVAEEVEVMVRAAGARWELYRQMQEEMKGKGVTGVKGDVKDGEGEEQVQEKKMPGTMPETPIDDAAQKTGPVEDEEDGISVVEDTHFIGVKLDPEQARRARRGSGSHSTSEEEDGVMVYTPTGSEDETES